MLLAGPHSGSLLAERSSPAAGFLLQFHLVSSRVQPSLRAARLGLFSAAKRGGKELFPATKSSATGSRLPPACSASATVHIPKHPVGKAH